MVSCFKGDTMTRQLFCAQDVRQLFLYALAVFLVFV